MPTQTRSRSRSDVGRKESKRSHKSSKRYSDDESSSERRERKSSRRAKETSEGGSKFKKILTWLNLGA